MIYGYLVVVALWWSGDKLSRHASHVSHLHHHLTFLPPLLYDRLTVIALTTRIQQLQTHMASHKKDKHSKRGMDALYVRRRKLLDYMERKDYDSYRRVVKTLGLIR